ncbi:MAG: hypothetical protein EX258_10180, partial [Sphingomonadaceae bacterium]
MSWKVTLDCTKAEAEAVSVDGDKLFEAHAHPPVLVADEPDPDKPDQWKLHAYFDHEPGWEEMKLLEKLAEGANPQLERLEDADWVTMSQAGIEPICAGRFFVHTPMHHHLRPDGEPSPIPAAHGLGYRRGDFPAAER